ncbi:MAG: hypothetical protein HQK50_19140 [Oligoflexia bacterium]|nr:hypothetical protein [Oligoflexia bacterium]MBF0367694.1 hypothetical protein [Oligoflexia bacterium]
MKKILFVSSLLAMTMGLYSTRETMANDQTDPCKQHWNQAKEAFNQWKKEPAGVPYIEEITDQAYGHYDVKSLRDFLFSDYNDFIAFGGTDKEVNKRINQWIVENNFNKEKDLYDIIKDLQINDQDRSAQFQICALLSSFNFIENVKAPLLKDCREMRKKKCFNNQLIQLESPSICSVEKSNTLPINRDNQPIKKEGFFSFFKKIFSNSKRSSEK